MLGWNDVGKLQVAAKGLGRLGTLAPGGLLQGLKIALGDPVPAFAGTAECNHAIIDRHGGRQGDRDGHQQAHGGACRGKPCRDDPRTRTARDVLAVTR